VAAREPSGRWVTSVPCDASLETPDQGGIDGLPARGQSVPVKPSRVQLAISRPAHLLRAAAQAAALLTVSTDWLGDARPRPDQAFSLSLVMGLTTIWVCPQKYTQV
jgi:hypothetical protein